MAKDNGLLHDVIDSHSGDRLKTYRHSSSAYRFRKNKAREEESSPGMYETEVYKRHSSRPAPDRYPDVNTLKGPAKEGARKFYTTLSQPYGSGHGMAHHGEGKPHGTK